MLRLAPLQLEEARWLRSRAAHGMDHVQPLVEERIAHDLAERRAELAGQRAGRGGQLAGAHVARRCVDQVTRQGIR